MSGSELVAAAPWLMIGGAAIALFGLAGIISSPGGEGRGGFSKAVTTVGLGFFAVGVFLFLLWGSL